MRIKKLATLTALVALAAFLALLATDNDRMVQADPGADVIIDWNLTTLSVSVPRDPRTKSMRTLAMVHAAMHDAINSIIGKYEVYAVKAAAPAGASAEAAAAAAAYTVLFLRYPDAKATLDAQLAASLAPIPDGDSKTDGIAVGEFIGAAIFDLRASDGYNVPVPYEFRTGPGEYQTPEDLITLPPVTPYLPEWGRLPPFVLKSPSQFRSEGPPPLQSGKWARDYNEVKTLGAVNSTVRTAEQTETALFWLEGQQITWNRIARIVAADQGNNMVENARLFALLNLSLIDAHITSWETKYHYNFWRPVTAIRAGNTDGNPKTVPDPSWRPLRPTPDHPDYTSGHAVFARASAEVLRRFFGTDKISFSFSTTTSPGGKTRDYQSFSQAAEECGDARVWVGFHFRSAVEDGLKQGKQVGHYIFNHALRPVEDQDDDEDEDDDED